MIADRVLSLSFSISFWLLRESLYSMNTFIFSVFMKLSPSLETLRVYKTISAVVIGVWQKRWDHAWHCCAIFQWQKSNIYIKVQYFACLPVAITYRNFRKRVKTPEDIKLFAFSSSLTERIHSFYLSLGKSFILRRKAWCWVKEIKIQSWFVLTLSSPWKTTLKIQESLAFVLWQNSNSWTYTWISMMI